MMPLLVLMLAAFVPQGGSPRESLKGVRTVAVTVVMNSAEKIDGMSDAQFKSDVVLKLSTSGIAVAEHGVTSLEVNINFDRITAPRSWCYWVLREH